MQIWQSCCTRGTSVVKYPVKPFPTANRVYGMKVVEPKSYLRVKKKKKDQHVARKLCPLNFAKANKRCTLRLPDLHRS